MINFVRVFQDVEEHLHHLSKAMNRLRKVNLKLSVKCHFFRQSVELLGHILTPQGLKQVTAVKDFPIS